MTSLKARAAALEEDKKALEADLPHLRGDEAMTNVSTRSWHFFGSLWCNSTAGRSFVCACVPSRCVFSLAKKTRNNNT